MASTVLRSKILKDTTIFVANLNWTTGQNELKSYFSKFGSIVRTTVVFDKDTGLSKGYGFVTFDKVESTDAALKTEVHSLDGRKLILTFKNQKK